MKAVNNYAIQLTQAKKRFLTYDQQELIDRCALRYDERYFYVRFLSSNYRICRLSGDMERKTEAGWEDGNSFAEVMVLLDWLCDSKPDRYISGNFMNIVTQGHYFHRNLQEETEDADAVYFDRNPQAFRAACEALGGRSMPLADMSYAIELVDGLEILVQFWHGDEEFKPRLRFFWDENVLSYIRYETTWYALGLLQKRLRYIKTAQSK